MIPRLSEMLIELEPVLIYSAARASRPVFGIITFPSSDFRATTLPLDTYQKKKPDYQRLGTFHTWNDWFTDPSCLGFRQKSIQTARLMKRRIILRKACRFLLIDAELVRFQTPVESGISSFGSDFGLALGKHFRHRFSQVLVVI